MGNSWALFVSGGEVSPVGSCPRTVYRKGTSIRQAPVFGTSEHYGKTHGSLWTGRINYNYTACCWFPTSSNILIFPSQFWQIGFESYWLHCSKCRILVLLRYLCVHMQYAWTSSICIALSLCQKSNLVSGRMCQKSNLANKELIKTKLWSANNIVCKQTALWLIFH